MVFHKSAQDRTIVVLLGGGEKDLNLMYDQMDKQNDKADRMEKHKRSWANDFSLIEEFFKKKNFTIFGSYPPRKTYKSEAIDILKKFFRQPAKHYVIYWGGHGRRGSGNWCFNQSEAVNREELTLQELLTLYQESQDLNSIFSTLSIVADTCHSEYWTELLPTLTKDLPVNILLQAASLKAELAFIVEGTKPRSNLMKKFIHEQEQNEVVESTYPWSKTLNQHPCFAFSESFESKQLCTIEESENEMYCVYNGLRFCQMK